MGQFVGPDWRTFSLRGARIERDEVEQLVGSGVPGGVLATEMRPTAVSGGLVTAT